MSDRLPHDEELAALYRSLPSEEPRAEVDEAILGAARRIADEDAHGGNGASQPARKADRDHDARERAHEATRRRFSLNRGWRLPLAAAASVALMLTLTRLTPEQHQALPTLGDERATEGSLARERTMADESEYAYGEPERTEEAPVAAPPSVALQRALPPASPPSASTGGADSEPEAAIGGTYGAAVPPEEMPGDPPRGGAYLEREAPEERGAGAPAAPSAPERGIAAKAAPAAAPSGHWPWNLEPGLDTDEACRRVVRGLQAACAFDGNRAVVTPVAPVLVDRGAFSSRRAMRVMLVAHEGRLSGMGLVVQGLAGTQWLEPPARER